MVGFLSHSHLELVDSDRLYGPFAQGMRDLGYAVGKNLVIEWRSAEGRTERLPELAAELVRLKPDVLVTTGTPAALAAQKATATIPIVMAAIADPIGSGLVKSLARPGGNVTGVMSLSTDLAPKHLELLREMIPKLTRVAVLANPSNPANATMLRNLHEAAQKLGVKVERADASTPQGINDVVGLARKNAEALIVLREGLFQQQRSQIVELATKYRLPSMGTYSEFAETGGLISYGQNIRTNPRRAAAYVDKIFKGAKPSDLPVEQPMEFELVVNRKTAKAFGLTIPQSLLISATKIID